MPFHGTLEGEIHLMISRWCINKLHWTSWCNDMVRGRVQHDRLESIIRDVDLGISIFHGHRQNRLSPRYWCQSVEIFPWLRYHYDFLSSLAVLSPWCRRCEGNAWECCRWNADNEPDDSSPHQRASWQHWPEGQPRSPHLPQWHHQIQDDHPAHGSRRDHAFENGTAAMLPQGPLACTRSTLPESWKVPNMQPYGRIPHARCSWSP